MPGDSAVPTTYGDAVTVLETRTTTIGRFIEDGDLAALQAEADLLARLSADVPKLAAQAKSGVPKSARAAVRAASKACATASADLAEASEAADHDAAAKAHAELVRQVEILKEHAPVASATLYACPMHPDVTSARPGQCTKCGMNLVMQARR